MILQRVSWVALPFLLYGLSGCTNTTVARAAEGGHLISCDAGMKDCVSQAGKICGDKGYTIMGGSSHTHVLGGSSSSYRAASEQGSLEIRCGKVEHMGEEPQYELPARADAAPVAASASTGPAKMCVPGATQRCVGAAACEGGQVCLADGQGFGDCDCGGGTASKPAAAESTQPSAPAEPAIGPTEAVKAPAEVPGAAPAPAPLKK